MVFVLDFMKYIIAPKTFLVKLCWVLLWFVGVSCAKEPDVFQSFLEGRPATFSLLIKNGKIKVGDLISKIQF